MPKKPVSQKIQFIAGFVIPTFILLTLSDESKLGPLWGMVLSLVFPVAIELFALLTARKQSILSLFAIIGILLVGAISLFGLSEEWLAARRAAIYGIGAIGLILLLRFKPSLVRAGMGQLLDMPAVMSAVKKAGKVTELSKIIARAVYGLALILAVTGVWSYALTLIVMSAETGTSEFNAQYAELRILSLPFITLPLLVVVVGLLMYVLNRIEAITGLGFEQLLKKK